MIFVFISELYLFQQKQLTMSKQKFLLQCKINEYTTAMNNCIKICAACENAGKLEKAEVYAKRYEDYASAITDMKIKLNTL